MPVRRWPRRSSVPPQRARSARRTIGVLLLTLVAASLAAAVIVFRGLVTELAESTARDVVVMSINAIVKDRMAQGDIDTSALVRVERDALGGVRAVTTNVAAVDTLAAEILELVAARTAEDVVTVEIPVGSLLGSTLLLTKGPSIPVEVIMLSSSVAGLHSEMTEAGINQTRHRLLLELRVDVSLLMPWRTVSTSVDTELLLAETIIVGEVPDTYMNLENEG